MRALLSVHDKTGIVEFARQLRDLGFDLVSTGGTLKAIQEAGIPAKAVSDVTGFPEILDGRVKTLHPAVHGGLLGRRDLSGHLDQMAAHGITPIDLLAVNLYPFEQTVAGNGVTDAEAIEQIDIGGPAMIRAAAKNHQHVLVVTSPADYDRIVVALRRGEVAQDVRRGLAAKAYAHTAAYDTMVADYLRAGEEGIDRFPDELTVAGRRAAELRYGENPQQQAVAYRRLRGGRPIHGVLDARQLGGKELSFNNLLDADAAWGAIAGLVDPAVSIVKHTIPCGLASRASLEEAYGLALAGDPVSAYGGIVALNRQVDEATADLIAKTFYEVIVAPGFTPEAVERLGRKKGLRLLAMPRTADDLPEATFDIRLIRGGLLVQDADLTPADPDAWEVVTRRHPTGTERDDLAFAWHAVRHVKSNGIALAREQAVVGVGSGQPNRLESVNIALRKAGGRAAGAALASDAFFPFADGLEAAIAAGVRAFVQPGGSVRDDEVIAAADAAGATMLFTRTRHFRH